MKRLLLQSTAFIRAARRLVKKNPEAAAAVRREETARRRDKPADATVLANVLFNHDDAVVRR